VVCTFGCICLVVDGSCCGHAILGSRVDVALCC
jgi:hypothetical protein